MRIRYDPEVIGLRVVVRDTAVTPKELADGTMGECDARVGLVRLDLLDANARLVGLSPLREVTGEGVGFAAPLAAAGIGNER